MIIREEVLKMKEAAPVLASSGVEQRNKALILAASALEAGRDEIFAANKIDLDSADANGVAPAVKKRLKFDEGKLSDVVKGLHQLAGLPDPLKKVTLARELDEGLRLYRVTCPIGVIGVIFEARPDALVQISSLCIKSGNCAILKGGKETANTNRVLFRLIRESVMEAGLPGEILLQAEQHNEIDELLKCHDCVDLLIPRGSNAFVQYIMNNTKIPVMGHADGICHIYVDKDYDPAKALPVILDAKMQYTAACNAAETLLVHRDIAADFLPRLAGACRENGIRLRGTAEAGDLLADCGKEAGDLIAGSAKAAPFEVITEDDFIEYLDLVLSVKIVDSVDEAIAHINRYGSHHTDSILTENADTAARFMEMVDSAGVYQNCSTRFADGFRYGFGAEVGISTGKIHARGPVGLEGLVTYKYKLFGSGHIVGDYAEGKRQFHFKDI